MKIKKITISILSTISIIGLIYGCSTTNKMNTEKSGAQLWGENCIRCHNTPAPETFSDAEWDVAVMHMRIRANLTAFEAEKIADFLKTAN